jgi:hypothetical protein
MAMARLEVVLFSDEHLEDAARLLAARHAHQREVEPLLPVQFEAPAAAREEVIEAWRTEGASGAAAFDDGRLVGYLIGAPRDRAAPRRPSAKSESIRGRCNSSSSPRTSASCLDLKA